MFPETGVVQNPPANHILNVDPSFITLGLVTPSKFQGGWETSITTPCLVQATPSLEDAYKSRFLPPSLPEYHILYVAPSFRTYGCRTPTLSADPGGPRSRMMPWRVHVAFVRARARSPEGSTSTFARWPARKSAWELCVHVIPRAGCVTKGAIKRTSAIARRNPRRATLVTSRVDEVPGRGLVLSTRCRTGPRRILDSLATSLPLP